MEKESVRQEHCEPYEYPPSVMRNLIDCKKQLKQIREYIESNQRLLSEYNKIEQPEGFDFSDAVIELFKRVAS